MYEKHVFYILIAKLPKYLDGRIVHAYGIKKKLKKNPSDTPAATVVSRKKNDIYQIYKAYL